MGEGPGPAPAGRIGRALVQLTRRPDARTEDPVTLLDGVPSDRFVAMAAYHRVPGVVYRSLVGLGRDDEVTAGLAGPVRWPPWAMPAASSSSGRW